LKTLSVRNVPLAIWQRARQNALASNLPFGEFVIRTLAGSIPFPAADALAAHLPHPLSSE
jgi:hypothetical protein